MKNFKRFTCLLLILAMLAGFAITAQASGKTYYTTGTTCLRSGPGSDSSVIWKFDKNTKVTRLSGTARDDHYVTWYKVKVKGHTGWMVAPKLSTKKNGDGSIGNLEMKKSEPIRKTPKTSAKRVGTADKGKVLKYYDYTVDSNGRMWFLIKIGGKIGWVSSKNVTVYEK